MSHSHSPDTIHTSSSNEYFWSVAILTTLGNCWWWSYGGNHPQQLSCEQWMWGLTVLTRPGAKIQGQDLPVLWWDRQKLDQVLRWMSYLWMGFAFFKTCQNFPVGSVSHGANNTRCSGGKVIRIFCYSADYRNLLSLILPHDAIVGSPGIFEPKCIRNPLVCCIWPKLTG